jgi:hypothetical protein
MLHLEKRSKMAVLSKRATIYFDPDIHKILKIKAAENSTTISELIDRAVKYGLKKNKGIFAGESDEVKQSAVYSERLVDKLRKDGKI